MTRRGGRARQRLGCVLAGVLVWCSASSAMTWSFEGEGNAQGWVAREPASANNSADIAPLLRSEVTGAIWRIALAPFEKGRNPGVELVSPLIGKDSGFFDRVTVRFRVVHSRPLSPALIRLAWTNQGNRLRPGMEPDEYAWRQWCAEQGLEEVVCRERFWAITSAFVYTTDWQELTLSDLRTGARLMRSGDQEYQILWEGELLDIRLTLHGLCEGCLGQSRVQGPEEVPEAVEVDWIRLTGVEEHLQGELPPPEPAQETTFGALFAPPVDTPLEVRRGSLGYNRNTPGAALGDVDGDGDADLVSTWSTVDVLDGTEGGGPMPASQQGWVMGYNDGTGRFTGTRWTPGAAGGSPVAAADLNGDGLQDLVEYNWTESVMQLVWNQGEKGMQCGASHANYPGAIGDADGDGDVDLWLVDDYSYYYLRSLRSDAVQEPVRLWLNDGAGTFGGEIQVPSPGVGYFHGDGDLTLGVVEPVLGGRGMGLLWNPRLDYSAADFYNPRLVHPEAGYVVSYLGVDGQVAEEPLHTSTHPYNIRFAGDFDGDGDTDLVVSEEFSTHVPGDWDIYLGLSFLANRGDGQMDTVATLGHVQLNHGVQMLDVNADGRLDAVFVHSRLQDPAVMVLLGQAGGGFLEEGRYPLEGGIGSGIAVLGGDVDGDGDVDVVVVERASVDGGRVHVLKSRLDEGVTAVVETGGPRPRAPRLEPAYPNPFNPGVIISFTLATAAPMAQLTIYNAAGQVVRRLALGALPVGRCRALWDGRDGSGQALASGVYVYRLRAGAWEATGKVVKSR